MNIETRLQSLKKDFDTYGQLQWNRNWPMWAWISPYDENFQELLKKENNNNFIHYNNFINQCIQ